jgi:DNA-binding transcriptional ArsR family regulator
MQEVLLIARALSDENRLNALLCLRDGERPMTHVARALDLAPSTVSRHLAILCRAGLVETRRVGRWHLFRLTERRSNPLVRSALAAVLAHAPAAPVDAPSRGR